jgi:hypothetical protein
VWLGRETYLRGGGRGAGFAVLAWMTCLYMNPLGPITLVVAAAILGRRDQDPSAGPGRPGHNRPADPNPPPARAPVTE